MLHVGSVLVHRLCWSVPDLDSKAWRVFSANAETVDSGLRGLCAQAETIGGLLLAENLGLRSLIQPLHLQIALRQGVEGSATYALRN